MAADNEPVNEWVEGYNESGKLLDRITRVAELQEQQKKMKAEEVQLNKDLQKEQQNMGDLQHQLKETNDKYAEEKQKLDELRSEQRVTLDGDQKNRIMTVTRETVDSFVKKIPRSKEEQMTVDVHFLTGTETTGFNLQLNGEGAGSRDAKFLVKLNQKVQSLAEQAAKYWGLDANKVFFLDRDGRIVLDSMNLKDIILPPADTAASAEAVAPGSGDQLATQQEKDLWMVRGRNYCLTLVRASTVLSKEDLNRPKGEKWEDFTFNGTELEKELERTRKKRAGEEGEAQKINMDAIPSLHELMQQGQEKKRKKRVETRCRCFELLVFILCEVCFLASIPNLHDYSGLPLIYQQAERYFTNFTRADNASAFGSGQASFLNIRTNEQYYQWLNGPLTRTLHSLTTDLGEGQMFLMGSVATLFEASANELSEDAKKEITYCTPEPHPPNTTTSTVITYTSTTSTVSGIVPVTTTTSVTTTSVTSITVTSTTVTSTSATRTQTSTSFTSTVTSSTTYLGGPSTTSSVTSSTWTSSTVTSTISTTSFIPFVLTKEVIPKYGIVCVPREFESCANRRVMNILGRGFFVDDEVPKCKATYKENFGDQIAYIFDSGEPFARSFGKVNTYYNGKVYSNFLQDISGTVDELMASSSSIGLGPPDSQRGFFRRDHEELFQSASLHELEGVPSTAHRRRGQTADATLIGGHTHREFVGAAHTYGVALYLPTINTVFLSEFVVENPFSGSLVTSIQRQIIHMDNELPIPTVLMGISMILAILVFFLEVRRILGCPRVCTFEEERSRCSVWTVFMLALVCIIPAIILLRNIGLSLASEALKGMGTLSETSETRKRLWTIMRFKEIEMNMKTVTMFVFSLLQLKFLLMHFPQLAHMTYVVKKIVKPLIAVVSILLVVLFSYGVMLTAIYGEQVKSFSSPARTWLRATLWSMGNIKDWAELYNLAPEIFPILLLFAFLVIQVTLNFLPAVVMISHKKDGDLFENYSYHNFWAIERTKQQANKDPHSTNPALIGFDFSGREPKAVERQEGWLAAAALMENKPSS